MRLRYATLPILLFTLVPSLGQADDKADCTAAYSSAQDLRTAGKLRASKEQLKVCSHTTCPAFMAHDCTTWLGEVDASIPTIVFAARDASGNDVLAVRVLVDGQPFLDKLDGSASPFDPGPHTVRFETPGAPPVEKQIVVRVGEKNRAIDVTFEASKKPEPAPLVQPAHDEPPVVQPAPSGPETPASTPSNGAARRGMLVAGVVVGVLGLASAGVGLYLGQAASDKWNNTCANPKYPDYVRTNPSLNECTDPSNGNSAATMADWATGLVIGGAVGVVAGTVLLIAAPSSKRKASAFRLLPALSPSGAGLHFGGVF